MYKEGEKIQPVIGERASSKFLGAVFGYMFIGLLITAAVTLGWGFLVKHFWIGEDGLPTETGVRVVVGTTIVCLLGIIIVSIVNSITAFRSRKAPWVGYVLYAVLMGGLFSVLVMTGVSLEIMAEAFGLTSIAFLGMFLIGYFSPININWFALIALGLGIGIVSVSLFWGIFWIVSPNTAYWMYWGISIACLAFCMLVTAIDAYRIRSLVDRGQTNQNLALFCAFEMYSDFIILFLRILRLLLMAKRN
jgi:FtsH-binding integral membrane protein